MQSTTSQVIQVQLFLTQIVLWSSWTLWIKNVQGSDGAYAHESITVVLVAEVIKLAIMQAYYLSDGSEGVGAKLRLIVEEWRYGLYFAVPAVLYFVYNLLFYVNMQHFTAATFRVLINVRILMLGVLVTLFFGKKLSYVQWTALFMLAAGCAVNQLGAGFQLESSPVFLGLLLIQAGLSAAGGVYSELLLKQADNRPFAVKNTYVYLFSLALGSLYMAYTSPHLITAGAFFVGWDWRTVVLALLQAVCGVSTSLLLRHLNVILKEYAQSCEMVVTAIASAYLFATPLNFRLFLSIAMVGASATLYSRYPIVQSTLPTEEKK